MSSVDEDNAAPGGYSAAPGGPSTAREAPPPRTDDVSRTSDGPLGILSRPLGVARTIVGGALMGVANLIPGISGGTMILAMGLYTEFIDSVADVTSLRLSVRRIAFLGVVGVSALAAIFGLAGVILYLLFHYTSAMFALFIGLTLGGAPTLAARLRPVRPAAVVATAAGLALMAGVAWLGGLGGSMPHNTPMDLAAGVIGATTMVLPGISGSYMLLVLDQYDRVIGAIDDRDFGIIIPVGIGAVAGIVALSNALKYLLHHYERATVGFLLGMLLGSVLGLWPFGREPGKKALAKRSAAELRAFGTERGVTGLDAVPDDTVARHILENWGGRTADAYGAGRVIRAVLMLILGFVTTMALSRGAAERPSPSRARAP